jgi:hypothetical protein
VRACLAIAEADCINELVVNVLGCCESTLLTNRRRTTIIPFVEGRETNAERRARAARVMSFTHFRAHPNRSPIGNRAQPDQTFTFGGQRIETLFVNGDASHVLYVDIPLAPWCDKARARHVRR